MTYRVVGIGEVLWDRFPDGDRLGGAPANFAFHAGQLGAASQIVSRIARDADGDRLAALLETRGLSSRFLQRDAHHPTGVVQVEIKDGQPSYVVESAAWDHLEWTAELKECASSCDAICFGTLAQRSPTSRQTIRDFVLASRETALRLFDLNLRQQYFSPETIDFGLAHATALKLNEEELRCLTAMFGWPAEEASALRHLFSKYPAQVIALTRGAEGCALVTRDQVVHAKAPAITCVDAVGAGDAFSAALVMGLLAGQPLEEIADRANRVGAFVASQPGGMPALPPTFSAA